MRTNRYAGSIPNSFERNGWLCGVPAGMETPGLMTGLVGIGHGLLRLVEPDYVPAVLLFDPPTTG